MTERPEILPDDHDIVPDLVLLDDYQKWAATTAGGVADGPRTAYLSLKIAGEAGEFAEKIGKLERDHDITEWCAVNEEQRGALVKELGDLLWYVSNAARKLNVPLSIVALTNYMKLTDRKERGVLGGSGDDR